jgi:hypothetical protein
MTQTHTTQPATPVLTPANFPIAVVRLARATDAELAEWDKRLPAALEQDARERAWNGRTRGSMAA